ncbi:transposable element Tcb1 transposase [Trichonephila clavipes]|nr:transposable element Tcb1 transposase [Trichonephila clavipes]
MERRARSQRHPITNSREDKHVIRLALMDHTATSRALSRKLGSFARQHMSTRTILRRLLQHGLSARRPCLRLPLMLHHRLESLQWGDQRRTWCTNLATLDAASQTGKSSMHQGGRIRVRWHRGERTLAECICHRYTGPSSGILVWGAIEYTSRSPLVCIDGTLNNARYISGVLLWRECRFKLIWGPERRRSTVSLHSGGSQFITRKPVRSSLSWPFRTLLGTRPPQALN